MPILKTSVELLLALAIIGCGDHGSAGPGTGEWATMSPEVFSHTGAAYVEDEKCTGQDGILISATSIGPVRLGRSLGALRARCEIDPVKVPGSLSINGPVLAISVDGGLILFTVAGHDSAVQTAGTSSPAFRTPNGIGVGSRIRTSPPRRSSICFRKDSDRIAGVLVSRRPRVC